LRIKYDTLLASFALNFSLRRYSAVVRVIEVGEEDDVVEDDAIPRV
jgi:hypothetical protein